MAAGSRGRTGSGAVVGGHQQMGMGKRLSKTKVQATVDEEQDSALRKQHAFSGALPQCRRGLDHSAAPILVPEFVGEAGEGRCRRVGA